MEHRLKETIALFARLGITAFGGPAAHIAMMRHEVVAKRKWMDDSAFMDLVGATNLIPGPNSTELAIHLGKERAGVKGLVAAGLFFILPAIILTGCIAWLYKNYGTLPEVEPYLYGIKPAIIAVILCAVWPMATASAKNTELVILGFTCLAMALLGFNEIIILFGAGLLYMAYKSRSSRQKIRSLSLLPLSGTAMGSPGLFFTFLKIGAILYGSGYVLFAFIDAELVVPGIISRQQLTDAIAVGQFTPGPVFSAATFIGYQVNGITGALAATAGIFLPSFVFVALLNRIVSKLKTSRSFALFLSAVNVASVAVIAAICWQMAYETIRSWETAAILVLSFALLFTFPKLNSAFIIVFGSVAGYILSLLH
ncbi:chromate transporter [Flavobacterium album]|uniref:Chromate transporter n=1 Tax=Flavobacterium album TaxID=2175091 RepID=A0A2S1QXS7_9FLAO|nr:chromate efflux transporter [Flavobacterium album]AWH85198.1 chromate transporter [Flavobacterium album]